MNAIMSGKCFECGSDLQLPICTTCNPEFDINARRRHAVIQARGRKLSWLATATQILGAAAVATNWIHPYWGYAIMLPGAIGWAAIALWRGDWSQASLQAAFVGLDIIGLARWAA